MMQSRCLVLEAVEEMGPQYLASLERSLVSLEAADELLVELA